ncbi:hypothetical protein JW979_12555, partial [bacterium]|nr:hypothetical protein [candidate division CSSED10-310 bacterium]
MKRGWILLALLVPLTMNAAFVPLDNGAEQADVVRYTVDRNSDGFVVEVFFPGYSIDALEKDGKTFKQVTINGCGLKGVLGKPYLPFKGIMVEIPAGQEVTISDIQFEQDEHPLTSHILPMQPPQPDVGKSGGKDKFVFDEDAYASNQLFPEKCVEITRTGFIRGRRVVFLEISPFQYNPQKKILFTTPKMKISLKITGKIDELTMESRQRLASDGFERILSGMLANYEPVMPMREKSGKEGADYLIITADQFADELASFAAWKTRKGYNTVIATLTDVGGSTSSDILSYLENAYDNWTPAPTYVLLVGDVGLLPSVTVSPDAYGYSFPSDLSYSLLDGGDYFPDIFLGRLSVQTESECTNVISKIMTYDRTPDIANWYNNALIAAYLQDYDNYDCYADRWFFETGTHVMDYLDNTIGMGIYTAMCTDNSSCNPYYFRSDSYPHRPAHPSQVPAEYSNLFTTSSQATNDVTSAINAGVGLVQHRDHGGETGWGDPPYSVSNVNALTNGIKTPVVFSINCLTGAFDYSSNCFAEAFQKHSNGGAVGIVAATRVSYSGYNDLLCHGTYTCFWPDYDSSHSGNMYSNSFIVCEALAYAKYYMYMYEGDSSATLYSSRLFHWFGDPEMMLRTDTPQTPGATLPVLVPVGTTQLTIPVSNEGALVAVSQNGLLLGSAYVSGGQVIISLSSQVQAGSPITIVITGYNLDPLEQDVPTGVPSCGVMDFDAEVYACNDVMTVSLFDSDLNANGSQIETVDIWVYSTTDSTGETITLTETGVDTAIFEGVVHGTSGSPGVGEVQLTHGDTIYAEYYDADCSGSPQTVTETAEADCQGPVISGVSIS